MFDASECLHNLPFIFSMHAHLSRKNTRIARQSLWSSTLSVGTHVSDGNNTPCFIRSSSFHPWQTRLVFVAINPAGLKIDKRFSSSENWQYTLFMFPTSLQVTINIIQPNYISIFSPDWRSTPLGEGDKTQNGCACRMTSVIHSVLHCQDCTVIAVSPENIHGPLHQCYCLELLKREVSWRFLNLSKNYHMYTSNLASTQEYTFDNCDVAG